MYPVQLVIDARTGFIKMGNIKPRDCALDLLVDFGEILRTMAHHICDCSRRERYAKDISKQFMDSIRTDSTNSAESND